MKPTESDEEKILDMYLSARIAMTPVERDEEDDIYAREIAREFGEDVDDLEILDADLNERADAWYRRTSRE